MARVSDSVRLRRTECLAEEASTKEATAKEATPKEATAAAPLDSTPAPLNAGLRHFEILLDQ
jgi:hypothetical protein